MLRGALIDINYFRIRWMSYLIGLDRFDYTGLKPQYIAEIDGRADDIMAGFLIKTGEPAPRDIRLNFDTPRNLLPEYGGYKGPGDWLNGLKFGEFVQCSTIIETMVTATPEDIAAGYQAIARIMYHIPEGDRVPELLAFHAPMLFVNVWRQIQRAPIEINGKKIDFTIIFKAAGPRRPDDKTGLTGVTFEVASAGLFGNVAEVENTDFWAVLLYLYKCKFEYLHEKRDK